jgi:DUF4097 and DUF4098 domain-containing protein YvlB
MIAQRLLSVVVIALAAVVSGCSVDADSFAATGRFERNLTVKGPVTLDIETGSGSIRIRRGTTADVRIVGHVRSGRGIWNNSNAEERVRAVEAAPPVAQTGNTIDIGRFERRELDRNISISYEITVPEDTRIRSRTGSGSQDIEAVRGPVDAQTGSGRIVVGKIAGAVNASTGSGSIEVLGAGDGLDASTGSGSITAREVVGSARARTGSGSITIEGTPTRDWSLDTGSGGITIKLPPTAAFSIDAQTGSGSVTTRHPIETTGSISKRHIQGRVRGGGPRIALSASSGSIHLD